MGTKATPQGFQLQNESVLGSLLSPTTMDTAKYGDQASRKVYFNKDKFKQRNAVQA